MHFDVAIGRSVVGYLHTGYIPKMANKWTLSCSSIARNVLICDEVIAKDTSISLMFFIYGGGTNKILTLSAKST